MGKTNRLHVGAIRSDPKDATKDQGHEYGKGRATIAHKHKGKKREKQKLKNQLRDFY